MNYNKNENTIETEISKIYNKMYDVLFDNELCDNDKLYICNKLVSDVLGE